MNAVVTYYIVSQLRGPNEIKKYHDKTKIICIGIGGNKFLISICIGYCNNIICRYLLLQYNLLIFSTIVQHRLM